MARANSLIDTQSNDNVIHIDLSALRKKRIMIDDDENRILELNTSDVGIISRLKNIEPQLEQLSKEATRIDELEDLQGSENLTKLGDIVADIDRKMRILLDDLFQSNVSEVCAPDGNMFDPFNGEYRWQVILNALVGLYEDTIEQETLKREQKALQQMKSHTDKYTG